MNRLQILKTSFTAIFFCFFFTTFSQNMVFKTQGDAIQADVIGMDTFLVPFKGFKVPAPRFEYLWITNDGQYYLSGDNSITHKFNLDKIGGLNSSGQFSAFATPVYSSHEDDEPPKIIIGNTPVGVQAPEPDNTESLLDSGFVLMQKNHLNIVPDDTTVFILSAKNNLQDSAFINTYLLMLYDAPISILNKELDTRNIEMTPVRETSSSPLYTSFDYERSLIYFDNTEQAGFTALDFNNISLGASFKKGLLYQLQELAPGEERHIYVQLKSSEVHLDDIPSGGVGGTRFVAVLLATDFQGNINLPALSNEEAGLVDEIKLSSLIDNGIPISNPTTGSGDTLFISDYVPIGLSEVYASVARSHDPNQIRLQSCECPANTNAGQQVICRVDFENNGAGATQDVSVSIPFPQEVDVSTFDGKLISLFPDSDALQADMGITVNKDSNSLLINFPGLRLEGETDGVDNYLSRTGHFTFRIFTKPGTDLTNIDPVQACIIFDTNPPFCTPESKIELVGNQSFHTSIADMALDCNKCIVPQTNNKDKTEGIIVLGMPLWLLILILLIIAVALYFAFWEE